MDKFNKFQILKMFLIVALVVVAPLLSTSVRSTYLYFVLNLLIIAVAAEAGLLSFFSKAAEHKKTAVMVPKVPLVTPEVSPAKEGSTTTTTGAANGMVSPEGVAKKPKTVEQSSSEKIVGATKVQKVKKCASTPSLFFIGGGETEAEELQYDDSDDDDDDDEEVGVPSGQELYNKSETFIGNFYKQLKMQREDSWKRIHELYQKGF